MDELEGWTSVPNNLQTGLITNTITIIFINTIAIITIIIIILIYVCRCETVSNLFSDHAAPLFFQKRLPAEHCAF